MSLHFVSLVVMLSLSGTSAPPGGVPRFERAACPVEVAAGERIDCGVLVVPENRRKADTRPLRLPVKCPELNALHAELAAGRLRGTRAVQALARAAGRCREALTSAGIDLEGYTSDATADDIEDLREALGLQKWHLHGFSYSTRLMPTVLRKHPAGVRSVILDSVLPHEVNFDEVATSNLLRALNLVFDGCAIARDCGAAHPSLRERFAQLIATAERRPVRLALDPSATGGKPVEVRGAQVVEALYAALHDPEKIPLVPRITPDWGRQLLESMPAARYVEMRGQSHGAGFNLCGARIIQAFQRAPDAEPPVDCALRLRGADFGLSARPRPSH